MKSEAPTALESLSMNIRYVLFLTLLTDSAATPKRRRASSKRTLKRTPTVLYWARKCRRLLAIVGLISKPTP
jgi:hypothetical protein